MAERELQKAHELNRVYEVLKGVLPQSERPLNCVCVSRLVVSDSLRPTDCSPPGSSVHGIFLQASILEWVAISSPGDFPDPGIEPRSPASEADSLPSKLEGKPG